MILHEVITAERVAITYRVAGLGARSLAWFVDFGLLLVLIFAGSCLGGVLDIGRRGAGMALGAVILFALMWGYFLLFEWLWHGQTPGKHLLGIRVITRQGTGVSFLQSAVRNILRVADGLPVPMVLYALGFGIAASNRESRRLGDFAADTLVVYVDSRAKPIQAVEEGRGEADRAWRAQVRQRLNQLSREQKQTLLDLTLRRNQLNVEERTRLFRATGEYFQSRMQLVPERYQSAEKFVLALAAEVGKQGFADEG
jgi:uncharacterized RDD family membrane protein YckC